MTRRHLLRAALAGLAGFSARPAAAAPDICRGDVPIDSETALLFPTAGPADAGPARCAGRVGACAAAP